MHLGKFPFVGRDHLHHLASVLKLLEKAVNLLNGAATASCNTLLTATVETRRITTLIRGHRANDGFNRHKCIIPYFDILHSLIHARNHAHKILYTCHLLDLRHLLEEILEIVFVLYYFLLQTARFLLVILLLSPLN